MPLSFGEVSGARNIPSHIVPDHAKFPLVTRFSIHFRTDSALLARQLPTGVELYGEPIATLYFATMKQIQWLAGRDYNVLSFSFPVTFKGDSSRVTAHFKSVLWESLPDPVISGREDLGFPKLWAEIPDPRQISGHHHYEASWLGFRFVDAVFEEGEDVPELLPIPQHEGVIGTLNHKYVPRSGERGVADIDQLIYWPQFEAKGVERANVGKGNFAFHHANWEDMPTMHHVINGLAALPVDEIIRAELIHARGQGDASNVQILR